MTYVTSVACILQLLRHSVCVKKLRAVRCYHFFASFLPPNVNIFCLFRIDPNVRSHFVRVLLSANLLGLTSAGDGMQPTDMAAFSTQTIPPYSLIKLLKLARPRERCEFQYAAKYCVLKVALGSRLQTIRNKSSGKQNTRSKLSFNPNMAIGN